MKTETIINWLPECTKRIGCALTHLIPHSAFRWTAMVAFTALACGPQPVLAAAGSDLSTVGDRQGLPPVSIQRVTNGFRLRFTGSPGQKYTIQRAPAATGPWTNLITRTAPSSSLLQYDDVTQPPSQAFYRTVHTNSGIMSVAEFIALPSKRADYTIPYGTNSNQFGELRVPPSDGPHPVVILIHGGCWSDFASLSPNGPMGDALKADGIATWNIEYRRLGQPGSGWPGTYLDVGRAVDHLRAIAVEHRLDLSRVMVLGHSAGGHLAMWVAARSRLPASSPIYVGDPLPICGVVNLAGMGDMEAYIKFEISACGRAVVEAMLGGKLAAFPERYAQASAIKMLPLGTPQVIVWGLLDDNVPPSLGVDYAEAARQAGDPVLLVTFPDSGHYEIGSPLSPTWPVVRSAIKSLLGR